MEKSDCIQYYWFVYNIIYDYPVEAHKNTPAATCRGKSKLSYLTKSSYSTTARAPGTPKKPAIKALITVIFMVKPANEPTRLMNHSSSAPQRPFHTSLNGIDSSFTTSKSSSTPPIIGPKAPSGDKIALNSILNNAGPFYIVRLFSSALDKVISSAYSKSPPIGRPWAIRLTVIPTGFSSCAR